MRCGLRNKGRLRLITLFLHFLLIFRVADGDGLCVTMIPEKRRVEGGCAVKALLLDGKCSLQHKRAR